ncbi:MAG: membrane protein insertion efficiency factor YidD [Minisyncoccia bacterium]
MRRLLIIFVKSYQKLLSPQTGVFRFIYLWPVLSLNPTVWAGCRHYPSCSQYCIQAISKHGVWQGLVLTVKRVIGCR